jgi:hypothetical protein
MLGLGSNTSKFSVVGKTIVRDGLVLQHNYNLSSVEPLSSGAASFDGTDDYISVGTSLWSANGDRTFSAWFRADNTSSERCIFHTGGSGELVLAGTNSACIRVHPVNSNYKDTTNQITAGRWYHIVLTQTSSVRKVYVDGAEWALDGSGGGNAQTTAWNNHAGELRIGDDGLFRDFFNGHMCNVGIWDAVLTQAQIKSIMNKNYDSLSASEKTDLVSWWNLDSTIPGVSAVYDNHGGAIGSNTVSNGDFETNLDGWTTAWWEWNALGAYHPVSGDHKPLYQQACVVGETYLITFDVNIIQGAAKFSLGTNTGNTSQVIAAALGTGSYSYVVTAAYEYIVFNRNNGGSNNEYYVDNVSVKLINGNTGTLS